MTWLKAINVFILQWFFIRLTRHTQNVTRIATSDFSITRSYQWYSIQYWILPVTGWGNEFIYLNKKPKFIKCSKKRLLTKIKNHERRF